MARKPAAEAPYAAFGALLDGHLRAGTRPDPDHREPWTNRAFAALMPARDADGTGASDRSVANWRKGTALPAEIEPILRALFGPLRTDGGAARATLRAAYDAARLARDRRTLEEAAPDPAGESFIRRDDQLAMDRTPAESDAEAAAEPDVAEEHALAVEQLRALADLVARRHNQLTDAWADLLRTAQRALAAFDAPTGDLPGRLPQAYQATVLLGALLDQQRALTVRPEPGEAPLGADLARHLGNAVTAAAPLLRRFPSVVRRDARLRDFLRAEDVPAARTIAAAAREREVMPPEDRDLLRDMEAGAALPGTQGEKSRDRLVATMRNALLAGAVSLVMSGYANDSPLVKRVSSWFVAAEAAITTVVEGMQPDVAGAIRHALGKAVDGLGLAAPPTLSELAAFPSRVPLTRWRERDEKWCPEMITVPSGSFLMGASEAEEGSTEDERPQRVVTVEAPFALGRFTVTFEQWYAAISAGAELTRPGPRLWRASKMPVINISWHDAQAFCSWLNKTLNLPSGYYRLPSEAEWEYVCRAGTTCKFSYGENSSESYMNFGNFRVHGSDASSSAPAITTKSVGSLPPNPWGFHEMHGNVWEWVEDTYGSYNGYPHHSGPVLFSSTLSKALRGGSWCNAARTCRSAARGRAEADKRNVDGGFRVAKTL